MRLPELRCINDKMHLHARADVFIHANTIVACINEPILT